MPAALHALTPVLAVRDPRGLALRRVDYCRVVAGEVAERRVQGARHDALGHRLESRDPRLWALHEQDSTTPANLRQVYSLSGRELSRDSVDAGFACTLFGEAGQAVWCEDGKGTRRELEYDVLLRPVALHEQGQCSERCLYAEATAGHALSNACGRLLRHDDTAGSLGFEGYSLGGGVSRETRRFCLATDWPDWPVPIEQRDALLEPEAARSSWCLGPLGDVLEQTDTAGNRQRFGLTQAGALREICLQVLAGAEHVVLCDARYNAFGQMEEETLGNGVLLQRRYREEDGRLRQLAARRVNGELLQDLHYNFDPVGNVLSIEDRAMPVRHFANQKVEPRCEYDYDSLYQLIEAKGWEAGAASKGPGSLSDSGAVSNYRQTYAYDAGGNLLDLRHVGAQAHGRTLVAARHANRCLPANEDFETGFDANGNLLRLQPGQGLFWNLRNELREVRPVKRHDGIDDRECYIYDSAGQRMRKLASVEAANRTLNREVRYLPGLERHENGDERYEVVTFPAGTFSVRVIHWLQGRPAQVPQDQVRYALTDHLGSSSLELDGEAGLISREVFHPFGSSAWCAARNQLEASYKTVRYSGKELDATGLYYYGARYYRADWQRWLNPDPIGEVDGMNLYRMVNNNPLGNIDLDGRESTPARKRWDLLLRAYNKPLAVTHVAPGVLRVRVQGAAELFKAMGFDLGTRFAGERSLMWLSIDSRYTSKISAVQQGRGGIPLSTITAESLGEIAQTASSEYTAVINGGFFNHMRVLAADRPTSTPIGAALMDGKPARALPLPEQYAAHYLKLSMDDKSFVHAAPLLASGGKAVFTEDLLGEPRFQFDRSRNLPGWLSHASEANTRSAISLPGIRGEFQARVRLIVGPSAERGVASPGYTLPEWAQVTARLDRMNPTPGESVNLDGGSSSLIGVSAGAAGFLTRGGYPNDDVKAIGNFITYSHYRR